MIDKIDLHTHSNASDGAMSPSEVARYAKKHGIKAIALTDHDTLRGVREFKRECEKLGIEGISGVEISAEHPNKMHIVGLFVDETDSTLLQKLSDIREKKDARNLEVIRIANENGFDITKEDLLMQDGVREIGDANRVHIASAMVKKGYVKNIDEAFERYLVRGKSCYVKRDMTSPQESIRMIKDAGGIAILAHAQTVTKDYDELFKTVKQLKEYGLDGVECYYNNYSEDFSQKCIGICDELNLLKSGGSDFHGKNKPDVEMGVVSTGYVPYSVLSEIKEKGVLR